MTNNLKFIEKYNNPRNIRFESFYKALSIASERNHKIIVEIVENNSLAHSKYTIFMNFLWRIK